MTPKITIKKLNKLMTTFLNDEGIHKDNCVFEHPLEPGWSGCTCNTEDAVISFVAFVELQCQEDFKE